MPKRAQRPERLSPEWDGPWSSWGELPAGLQVAIDWAWRNAQPETPKDRARLVALDGLISFEKIFHHEGIRWTNRHLKRLLPWLSKEDRYEALAQFFPLSKGTIRSFVEGSDSGPWRAAREAEKRESHVHKDETEQMDCAECLWIDGVRPGSEGFGAFSFPRKGEHQLAFRRVPWSQEGNHRYTMFGVMGSSAGLGGRWRVSIHLQEMGTDGEVSVNMAEEESWDEFPVPEIKSFHDGWVDLFRVMPSNVKRIYTLCEPTLETPTRHLFPTPQDRQWELDVIEHWSKQR